MSEESDPRDIRTALDAAIDAFNEEGFGVPNREEGFGVPNREEAIATDDDWKTQLTKACRLLDAVARIDGEGHYTAVIELCFGAVERSIEAYALAAGGDGLIRSVRSGRPLAWRNTQTRSGRHYQQN